ncbi:MULTISPECIES: cupin domain-containing protein [unclassified Photobacterium]|uniref:cupin domain-containing protein n=1 Tax=unclassified Photobacterium TaxID=2628852 RepID=UPI001EDE0A38|nr:MULTISPECIES: cupin domain-containing protein [unclassified Photobacterium]MCG3863528.1 cupin domain-containing protein [Photobacterium sp. Ph6]MCG3875057.1 cupin domain-containing protein [Photobacterium sp. Ph5]
MMNIFSQLPAKLDNEEFIDLLKTDSVRIERIVSQGHITPIDEWYDQSENEWVIVLEGRAEVSFTNGEIKRLEKGDHLYIPAHQKHRVSWTEPNKLTIWLAVFFN